MQQSMFCVPAFKFCTDLCCEEDFFTSFMLNLSVSWTGEDYPEPLKTVYIITGLLYLFLGVSGNGLIIVSILTVKQHRSCSNAFIINLAASDILLAGYILPITLVDLLQATYPVRNLCVFNGALYRVLSFVSVVGKTLVAVSRFFQICRSDAYRRFFKKRKVILICVSLWTAAGASVWFSRGIGAIEFAYDPKIHICRVIFTDLTRANSVYFSFIALCIGIALFCYAKVYKKVKTSVDVFATASPQLSSRGFCRNALDSVRTNCIIFIVHVLCITPDISLSNFAVQNVVVRGIAANLRFAGTVTSFVMYGALNKSISKTYKDMLCRFKCVCLKEPIVFSVGRRYAESTNNRPEAIFHIAGSLNSRHRNDIESSMI